MLQEYIINIFLFQFKNTGVTVRIKFLRKIYYQHFWHLAHLFHKFLDFQLEYTGIHSQMKL